MREYSITIISYYPLWVYTFPETGDLALYACGCTTGYILSLTASSLWIDSPQGLDKEMVGGSRQTVAVAKPVGSGHQQGEQFKEGFFVCIAEKAGNSTLRDLTR
jgi:hypothetical protein